MLHIKIPHRKRSSVGVEKNMRIGVKQATEEGYIEMKVPGVCDLSFPASKSRRGRVQGGDDSTDNNNLWGSSKNNQMVKQVGFYNSGTGQHQSNTVYHSKGSIPAITTITGGTQQIKVLRKWKRK